VHAKLLSPKVLSDVQDKFTHNMLVEVLTAAVLPVTSPQIFCPLSVSHLKKRTEKSQFNQTSLEMAYNIPFRFVKFTTRATAEMLNIRVHQLMRSNFTCCEETLWTVAANIWLHAFM